MGLGKILGGFLKTHLVTLSGNLPPKSTRRYVTYFKETAASFSVTSFYIFQVLR
jgi:hypothetical protein